MFPRSFQPTNTLGSGRVSFRDVRGQKRLAAAPKRSNPFAVDDSDKVARDKARHERQFTPSPHRRVSRKSSTFSSTVCTVRAADPECRARSRIAQRYTFSPAKSPRLAKRTSRYHTNVSADPADRRSSASPHDSPALLANRTPERTSERTPEHAEKRRRTYQSHLKLSHPRNALFRNRCDVEETRQRHTASRFGAIVKNARPGEDNIRVALALSLQEAELRKRRVYSSGGICNVGNSCYMNAVLQAFGSLRVFTSAMLSHPLARHPAVALKTCSNSDNNSRQWSKLDRRFSQSFFANLVRVLSTLHSNGAQAVNVVGLKRAIGSQHVQFAGRKQQDAHEFFSDCINQVNRDIVEFRGLGWHTSAPPLPDNSCSTAETSPAVPRHGSDSNERGPNDSVDRDKVASHAQTQAVDMLKIGPGHKLLENSPNTCTFHSQVERALICSNDECGYRRVRIEHYYDFSVDLPDHTDATDAAAGHQSRSRIHTSIGVSDIDPPNPPEQPTDPSVTCNADLVSTRDRVDYVSASKHVVQQSGVCTIPPRNRTTTFSPSSRRQKLSEFCVRQVLPSASVSPESLLCSFFEGSTIACRCPLCDNDTAKVEYSFRTMPEVLVLHLKRFSSDIDTGKYTKRRDRVAVQSRLNLSFAAAACAAESRDLSVNGDADMHEAHLQLEKHTESVVRHALKECDQLQRQLDCMSAESAKSDFRLRLAIQRSIVSSPAVVRERAIEEMRRGGVPDPDKLLELRCEKHAPPFEYALRSVIRHMGSCALTGHYVTDICDKHGMWKRYNDQFVTPLDVKNITSESAERTCYVLCYEKVHTNKK